MDAKLQQKPLADLAEKPHIHPRRDVTFYIVFLVAVLPLWSIVPLSWAFVIHALRSGCIWTFAWRGQALFVAALCEVFFSVYHYRLTKYISGPCPNPPGNLLELQSAFQRVLHAGLASLPEEGYDEESLDVDRPGSPAEAITVLEYNDSRAVDFRNYLRTWFNKAPWSSIRRQEVHAWLYWSIFNAPFTSLEKLPHGHRKVLQEVIQMLEYRAGSTIPEGSNPAARPLLLTLDPVIVSWRPFVWYAAVTFSNFVLRRRFESAWGAEIRTYKGLEYILRAPSTWDPLTGPRPIVFMHGLGLGLTQYRRFIQHILCKLPNHPVLVPLLPHVSQEIFHPRFLKPMGRREMTECLAGLLVELGWTEWDGDLTERKRPEDLLKNTSEKQIPRGVTMLSHSNGSFSHAWMLKHYPAMITRSCFVDPVTFCSWEGDLCYNFVYRPCSTGFELLIKYFVGTELGVANFLQRHFDWSSNSLWYEEIPDARDPTRAMFFLGGKDAIIDAYRVKQYLTSHGVRKGLWFDPHGRHGQALLSSSPGHREILRWLQQPQPSS